MSTLAEFLRNFDQKTLMITVDFGAQCLIFTPPPTPQWRGHHLLPKQEAPSKEDRVSVQAGEEECETAPDRH